MDKFNMICGGSPCFVEGTLVLTSNGYTPIECLSTDDLVLTHTNKYQRIKSVMTNETDELIGIKASPSEIVYCTPSHPLYIRKQNRVWNKENGSYDRVFNSPEWVEAKGAECNDYIGTAINQIEELPQWDGYEYYQNQSGKTVIHKNELSAMFAKHDFWYIVGRYIGDGWLKKNDGKSVIICSNHQEVTQITSKLDNLGLNYCVVEQGAICRVQFVKKELYLFLERFGSGAANKHLTKDVLNLPADLLRDFLFGYVDADGTFTQGRYKIVSVSRKLMYEVGACVAKAFHRPYSIYFIQRPKSHCIEGRIVNQRDQYQLCWKPESDRQDHSFYENGYIWSPITKIIHENEHCLVYNIEVDADNSYMVQGLIVHNCQDFSIAGKQEGSRWHCNRCHESWNPLIVHFDKREYCPHCGSNDLDKTRSSLLVEWLRIIRANKPKWAIYENVKALTGKKFKETFQMFLDELDEYGYNTYWRVLNAKDYGIPQNRERVYVIIIRKDLDNGKFEFPEPIESEICMKDLLEDRVDEAYYVNTPRAQKLIEDLMASGKLTKQASNTVRGGAEGV